MRRRAGVNLPCRATGNVNVAEILKIRSRFPEPSRIVRAAELVRQGQVIAIPTDTFYGLAANPFDPSAVQKIFALKNRPESQPLLLLVDSLEMAADLSATPPPEFYRLAEQFWPGPLTIVVEASPKIPPPVTAHTGRIGLRLPSAPIPVALIEAAGCPLTATSANVAGGKECSTAQQVNDCLGSQLPLIVDGGDSRTAEPSTVLDLRPNSWEILREGGVAEKEIQTFFAAVRKNQTGPK